ncbi:MAG: VOC family protein [Bacteroidota bacterium]
MYTINRLMTNICSDHLAQSKAFYTTLFDLEVNFDSDWFVQLVSKDKGFELGIIDRKHEMVPEAFQHQPTGFYLTFVVENADAVFELAKEKLFEIVQEPEDTFYGQRRLLLKDPDGTLLDVSSLIPA